jgi:hypothetical protein
MWLFDDLLKKPTTAHQGDTSTASWSSASGTQGGGNPPVDPLAEATPIIKIEKSSEISMITESPAETASSAPPPAPVIATDDISSIIINREPSLVAPIIIGETPSVISQVEVSNTPIATTTPVIATEIDLGNLFGTSTPTDATISAEEVPAALEVASVNPVIEMITPVAEEVEVEVEEVEESPLINFAPVAVTPEVEAYERTSDFIAGSIAKIDTMITRIDTAHSVKLGEALGYKTEKEKYTTLEESTYADAQSLVEEKDQALTMRAYFVAQGSHGSVTPVVTKVEESNSVETTLTELAVQNAVTETVKPVKKAKAKVEDELVGLTGI